MTSMSEASSWFIIPQPNTEATHRLFCFHYAGGNGQIFYPWVKELDPSIELVAIQLPGHGTRFNEPLATSMDSIVDSLGEQIVDYLDKPYTFFGHSLGGLMAYALTHWLQKKFLPLPDCLYVSGKRPPHIAKEKMISHLPDAIFLEEATKYNGVPSDILQNQEFLDVWLPILRADFQVLETYISPQDYSLSCDLVGLGGLDDIMVPPSSVKMWSPYTSGAFSSFFYPGNHFYINTEYAQIIKLILQKIRSKQLHKASRI